MSGAEVEISIETKDKEKGPEKWDIECWTRTVIEAEEIKADPEKMKHVALELEKKKKALDKITPVKNLAELRKKANEFKDDED